MFFLFMLSIQSIQKHNQKYKKDRRSTKAYTFDNLKMLLKMLEILIFVESNF